MVFRRLRLVAVPLAFAAALSGAGASSALAQGYPAKPVRMFVGYTAGGAVDIVARVVGQQIAAGTGQSVIVENKPGAGTNIAMRALIDSPPDGYTLMMAANALAANPALFQPPPFDLRDVTPIALIGRVPVVIAVSTQSPLDTLPEVHRGRRSRSPMRSPSARRATARRRISRWSCSSAPPASALRTCPIAAARRR